MNKKYSGKNPPKRLTGWGHSRRVLVWYKGKPELKTLDRFGIAYYHYQEAFGQIQHWVSFTEGNLEPDFWWELPDLD